MSPVVNVAAASAPPRNSSNISSSKARSQSARSYLHKQYLKVRLNRLQKHRPKVGLKSTLIHLSAWRDCMKSGPRIVFRYSSRYEKALPNRSLRCRMEELHRASYAPYLRTWSTENPQPPRDPRRNLLHLEKRLPMAPTPSRFSSMAHRLPLLQEMAYRWHLGKDQPGYPRTSAGSLEQRSSA